MPFANRIGKVQLDRGKLTAAREAFAEVADEAQLRSPANDSLGQIALLSIAAAVTAAEKCLSPARSENLCKARSLAPEVASALVRVR